ncbi:hypothetical protein [Spirosoma sp. KNUC1025]|uniref:hypothetical protein n=1 Tax=Spirosoma sp. KNUC1025 TaxID=2894082 RepID=UPI00386350FA|nr:hypothetical protein LN737_18970 [Spirosoma sp. KNUC1025]
MKLSTILTNRRLILKNKLLEEKKLRANLYLNRAIDLYQNHKYTDALLNCNLSLDLDSTNREAYRVRGLIWYQLGNIQEAGNDLQQAARLL